MKAWVMGWSRILAGLGVAVALAGCSPASKPAPTAPALRVVLIPADGGTEQGTLADYRPIFEAVGRTAGLTFDIKVAQSYGAVVEALCGDTADIAFVGPVTYLQARDRGCAELLAVAEENGESVYYSGLFVRADSDIKSLGDLKGRRVAFGDVNSTTSFLVPVALLMDAGLAPARDFSELRLVGSHSAALAALLADQVDMAPMSFDSFEKALAQGAVKTGDVRVLVRSAPIPYPPLVMRRGLDPALKQTLRDSFAGIASAPGVTPQMIRGYGGKQVDGYRTDIAPSAFDPIARTMQVVTDDLKGEMLKAAAAR